MVFMAWPSATHASIIVQPIPTVGLTAHWTFDSGTVNWAGNTVSDVSGNSNTGTLMFMDVGTNQVAGKRAQALYFDGILDYVSLAANPLSNLSGANSMCAWVKDNDISQAPAGWNQTFLNLFTNVSNGLSIGSVANSGVLFASYRSGGTYYGAKSTGSVFVSGTWVHVCYVWNGAGIDLYANGAAIASTTNSDTIGGVNTIGARNDVGDGAWLGSVDDMRIYSRALSAAEVKLIYQSGALVFKSLPNKTVVLQKTTQNFLNDGLVGYWSFDGGKTNWAANTTQDSSVSGNTGTMTNMSTTSTPVMGRMGQALDFDGVNDRVDIPTELIGTGAVTVSAWVHPRTSGGSDAGNILSNRRFKVTVDSTPFRFFSSNGTGNTGSAVVPALFSAWTHVVVTRSAAGLINFYVNGAQSGTADQDGGTPQAGVANLNIGNTTLNESPFDGPIDEVRIYNRILSLSEIKQLYSQGR